MMAVIEHWGLWKKEDRYLLTPIKNALSGKPVTFKTLYDNFVGIYTHLELTLKSFEAIAFALPRLKVSPKNKPSLNLLNEKFNELNTEATNIKQFANTSSSRGLGYKLSNPQEGGHSPAEREATKQEMIIEMLNIKKYQDHLDWFLTEGLALVQILEQELKTDKNQEYDIRVIIDNVNRLKKSEEVYTLK